LVRHAGNEVRRVFETKIEVISVINKNERILILSPHTDDAELVAGAYISLLIEAGLDIFWVVFSTARESIPHQMHQTILQDEFISVMQMLGIDEKQYLVFDYTVRRLNEKRQDILETLVRVRNDFLPDLVIGPSLNDFHQDHQIVANEMVRAFKSQSSILSYELPWNNIKFENNYFVRVQERHIQSKLRMLDQYKSQILKNRNYFNPDFIRGLAITRGTQVDTMYAEAFEVLRWIL
jgi:N-acetylglucosamine malate deacetylase 1